MQPRPVRVRERAAPAGQLARARGTRGTRARGTARSTSAERPVVVDVAVDHARLGDRHGSVQPRPALERVEVVARRARRARRGARAEVPALRAAPRRSAATTSRRSRWLASTRSRERVQVPAARRPPRAARRTAPRAPGRRRGSRARAGRRRGRRAGRDRPRRRSYLWRPRRTITAGAVTPSARYSATTSGPAAPRDRAGQQRHEAAPSTSAVELRGVRVPAQLEQRRREVEQGHGLGHAAGREPPRRPRDQRHARGRVEEGHLVPEPPLAQQLAVVGGEERRSCRRPGPSRAARPSTSPMRSSR